jgi:flagellar FliL protein
MGERDVKSDPNGAEENATSLPRARSGLLTPRNIIIIVVGVAVSSLLAILTVGTYIAPSMEKRSLNRQAQSSAATDASYLEDLSFFRLDPMIVNPADSNGERYLKAAIALEMYDAGIQQEIEKRLPQIKNQINNVLSSKSIEQIKTNEDKEKLRREILTRVNGMLVTGRLSNVYFEEFVYQ